MRILRSFLRPALGLVLAALALRASAGPVVVDTAYVVQAIGRNAIVWDVRAPSAYKQGHIPGAVNVGDVGKVLRDENTEDYIAHQEIEKLLGNAGIDPSREVIVYGAKANPYVYFGLVTLQYFGASNARVYHGGIDDWKDAGQKVTTEPTRLAPVTLKLRTPGISVPRKLEAIVMRLMRKDPAERYESARAFITALDAAVPRAKASGIVSWKSPLPPSVAGAFVPPQNDSISFDPADMSPVLEPPSGSVPKVVPKVVPKWAFSRPAMVPKA